MSRRTGDPDALAGTPELPHDREAGAIADRYLREGADATAEAERLRRYPEAGSRQERDWLLDPPSVGRGGEVSGTMSPVSATQLGEATTAVTALRLDRADAQHRLERIRHWMLEDPEFERSFWGSIRRNAEKGQRHAQNAILRLIYGWQEHDNLAEKLGATIDEARRALNVVGETSNLTEDDVAENVLVFFRWYREVRPERAKELFERMARDRD